MIRATAAAAFLTSLAFVAVCSTAGAQQAAPAATTARCGGVLCDLYYRDVPEGAPIPSSMTGMTALPCHDFVCGMFGGRTPDQPVVAQFAPEPIAEPVAPRKKKHIAKAKIAASTAADAKAAETATK